MIFREMNQIYILELLLGDLMQQTYEYIVLIDVEEGAACSVFMEEDLQNGRRGSLQMESIEDVEAWLTTEFVQNYVGDDEKFLHREMKLSAMAAALENDSSAGVSFSVDEDGKLRRKHMEYRYLNGDRGLICLTRQDVTRIYEEEENRSRLLENALDVAQKANRVKCDFLQNLSHDIRTPLHGMNGMLELALQDGLSKEEILDYLYKAQKSAAELTKLMNHVLDLSVIDMGQLIIEGQPIVLKDFLEDTKAMLEPVAKEKRQRVIFDADDVQFPVIKADPDRWRQVFLLIMDDFLQYGCEGGCVRCKVAVEKKDEEKLWAILTFSDNGRQDQEHGKSALGLTLANNIVHQCGGFLRYGSRAGRGVVIIVEIPCKEPTLAEEDFERRISHMVRKMDQLDLSSFRALVVDDNDIAREIIKIRLQRFGLQVDTACGGQEAIDLLNASEQDQYHIVFMAAHMRGKSGLQVAMELKTSQRKDLSDITLVGLTPYAFKDERFKILESGMDYHLPLPTGDIELKEIFVKSLFNLTPKREAELMGLRRTK